LYHISNGGAAKARNFAIEQITTEIFIPVDADDLLEPTFLEYL
jgi:glycosyltransferase involved in cell wall biosynthesis